MESMSSALFKWGAVLVAIVGLFLLWLAAYKADIDDDRESPSFEIIERLREGGAAVAYCDPYIPVARPGREHDIRLSSVPCSAEEFARHDVLVVSTAHDDFRDPFLYRDVKLVVDTRNLMAPLELGPRGPEIVQA